jgi:hypothetical protein
MFFKRRTEAEWDKIRREIRIGKINEIKEMIKLVSSMRGIEQEYDEIYGHTGEKK